jgi:secondary thiamine-phosphate synthase enzyme
MASALSGMSVVYDKEGIDPCIRYTHCCECVPVTLLRTGINGDESGVHHCYEVWLEELAPHAPIDQYWHNRTGEDNADAHLKRQIMGREVVVAVTNGRLDGFALLTRTFSTWERIFYGEFDGRRRKRVLVKIIGE